MVSRARPCAQCRRYKGHLAACDQTRRNDLDGRGNLSEEALAEFTRFFLTTCLDQVSFMEGLMQPDTLRTRILLWAEEQIRLDRLPPKSGAILEAVLYRGELPRGDAAGIVGTGERQARRVVSGLTEYGVLVSESSRAPLRLAFPGRAGIALDAGSVPGERGMKARSDMASAGRIRMTGLEKPTRQLSAEKPPLVVPKWSPCSCHSWRAID